MTLEPFMCAEETKAIIVSLVFVVLLSIIRELYSWRVRPVVNDEYPQWARDMMMKNQGRI